MVYTMPTPKPYRAKDGSVTWRVRIRHNQRQTTETFTTRQQAESFCAEIRAHGVDEAVKHRDRVDTFSDGYIPTVREMLTLHVEQLTGVDQRTRDDYLRDAERYWLPLIGNYRVDTIDRPAVARVVNKLDGRYSPKSIRNAHSLLSSVMQSALYAGHIDANPCRGTRLPRAGEEDVEEIRFLSYSDFDLLLSEVPEFWQPFVILLFGTGLRFSEATAIQVRDINLDTHPWPTLRVVRAWKKGNRIGPPKSKAGRRTITLPHQVTDAVLPLLDRPGAAWLFTTETGQPVRHNNFFNRVWKPATIRASICADHLDPDCRCVMTKHAKCPVHTEKDERGWHVVAEPCGCKGTLSPRPRIHDARHTHASWLIAQGIRLEVVQDRLGHEEYTTTRKVYGHLMPDMRHEAGVAAQLAFEATKLAAPKQLN